MDDLTARIDAMFRRYAADLSQKHADGVQLAKQFRKNMDSLIAKYGNRPSTRRWMSYRWAALGRQAPCIDPMRPFRQ